MHSHFLFRQSHGGVGSKSSECGVQSLRCSQLILVYLVENPKDAVHFDFAGFRKNF